MHRRHDLELDGTDEIIWSEIKFHDKVILLCTIYRPETTRVDFWGRLQQAIGSALDETPYIVLNGDWNIDFMTRLPNQVNTTLQLYCLRNVITEPTRCTDISSTCIDPVLIADSLQSLESGTVNVPSHMSDHSGTYTVLEIECPIPRTYTRDIRIYKDANFDALKRDIATTDWEALFESPNIDINVLYFNKKLTDFVNQHVPQKNHYSKTIRQTVV